MVSLPLSKKHLEDLGLIKQAEWVEFQIKIFKAEDALKRSRNMLNSFQNDTN